MNRPKPMVRLLSFAVAMVLAIVPAGLLSAQAQSRLVIGIGLGRQFPQEPIVAARGAEPEFWLDDASASSVAVEYWWTRSVATRLAYQWVRTDISKPDIQSFARINSLYGGVILAPVAIAQRLRPFIILGGGVRRYDVNALLAASPSDVYDIAPKQYRPAGYAGVGSAVRIRRLELVPEAAVYVNSFKPERGEAPTQVDLVLSVKIQAR